MTIIIIIIIINKINRINQNYESLRENILYTRRNTEKAKES